MSPRNEFADHGDDEVEILYVDELPYAVIIRGEVQPYDPILHGDGQDRTNTLREEGEHEDLSQEVPPIEEDPHLWPESTLADLRKEPGFATTEAHLRQSKPR